MADPYAAREGGSGAEAPATDTALLAAVTEREGLPALSCRDLAGAASRRFVAVILRDEGLVPPLARLRPEQAAMLLAGTAADARELERAREAVERAGGEAFLLKEGLVGGPAGRVGAFATDPELIARLLDAALGGRIGWERDPDFGYEVPAQVPGVEGAAALALCPRLLYAELDRVYEHADLVVEVKRLRHRRVTALAGVDPTLLAATGWPVEPTGSGWKDDTAADG